jgi:hypothetical protein
VLDFKTKLFYDWDSDYLKENPVYSTLMINRNMKQAFTNLQSEETQKCIDEVKVKVFENALGELYTERVLHFLSRAYAGHYEDKDWAVWIGNRNCGKGVMDALMKSALNAYSATIPSGIFINDKNPMSGDESKKLSWCLDLQFIRCVTTQEILFDRSNKNLTVNGVVIKKLASGGDPMRARKNYQDEVAFTMDAKLFMMVNDLPPVEPKDTLETCVEFQTYKQFKTQAWITEKENTLNDEVKNHGADKNILLELKKYSVADDDIKYKCTTEEWKNAFIFLLLKSYSEVKVPMVVSIQDDEAEDGSLTAFLLRNFRITENKGHRITSKELKDYYKRFNHSVGDSLKKFKTELCGLGARDYKCSGTRGLEFVEYIGPPEEPAETKKD